MAPMLLIGIGCFLLMPAGGGMFALMGKAAAASMIPQFTNGLVINDGNPFEAFKELTNPDNVRATVLAAATAGVLNGFDIAAPFGSTDLLEHATYAVQSAAVRTPLEMLIARRDMAETIRSNAMGIVANSLGSWAASHIGALYHPADGSAPQIDPITHKVLHFGGGAATAAIMGEDWVSGGAGAVAGEIAGEFYRNTFMSNLKPNTPAWNAAAQRGADVARISAIAFATACGLDPSTAAHTAGQAAENNCFQLLDRFFSQDTADLAAQEVQELYEGLSPEDRARLKDYGGPVVDAFCEELPFGLATVAKYWNRIIDLAQGDTTVLQRIVDRCKPTIREYCGEQGVCALDTLVQAHRNFRSEEEIHGQMFKRTAAECATSGRPNEGMIADFIGEEFLAKDSLKKKLLHFARLPENCGGAALMALPVRGKITGVLGKTAAGGALKTAGQKVGESLAQSVARVASHVKGLGEGAPAMNVLKYFGKGTAPATQAANQNILRMQHKFTVPGGAPIKPVQLPGPRASVPAASSSSSSAAQALAKVHKNSNAYEGETILYAIFNAKTGQLQKFGETAAGFDKLGNLIRAMRQIRKLEKTNSGEKFGYKILGTHAGKKAAREAETRYIKTHRKIYSGKGLPLNKSNH
ncbi:MAG: hypothetical protein LCH26_06305 [Proteobacteria bacterium]|nr:hypothetical protein [Pseudomonadota bacterium]